jgi:hypothetical protein
VTPPEPTTPPDPTTPPEAPLPPEPGAPARPPAAPPIPPEPDVELPPLAEPPAPVPPLPVLPPSLAPPLPVSSGGASIPRFAQAFAPSAKAHASKARLEYGTAVRDLGAITIESLPILEARNSENGSMRPPWLRASGILNRSITIGADDDLKHLEGPKVQRLGFREGS